MLTDEVISQYEATIGIECHVQLKTKTKLFSAVSNDAVGKEPNTVVSPICFGLPGVLPVLNEAVVELAIKAGIALNAKVANFSKFDRKHYFYPDLPKGYQITQFDQPIVGKGHVDVPLNGETIKVGITRAHLEEDAGKLTHPAGADYSLVDLNRAGTPLLEIVSDPDMHSAKAARAYAQELYYLMKYASVSNVNLFHGNMRFDVNVSVAKKGSKELGTRSEVKNINSFKAVEKAAEYEIERQIELLEKGQEIAQETRGWDDAKQKTISQRSKEDSHDYRYFPEPDLPPVAITDEQIEQIRGGMPSLPPELRRKLSGQGLNSEQITVLMKYKSFMDIFVELIDDPVIIEQRVTHGKVVIDKLIVKAANWLVVDVVALLKKKKMTVQDSKLTGKHLRELFGHVSIGLLNSTQAKLVLFDAVETGDSVEDIYNKRNSKQISGEEEMEGIVTQILSENKKAATDVKNGEMKAIGFLVGQVMKNSKGKANPQMAQELIKKQLEV